MPLNVFALMYLIFGAIIMLYFSPVDIPFIGVLLRMIPRIVFFLIGVLLFIHGLKKYKTD